MTEGDRADWLGAIAGNTRLHWGCYCGDRLLATWDGPHVGPEGDSLSLAGAPAPLQAAVAASVPLHLASVVAAQTRALQRQYQPTQVVSLATLLAAVTLAGAYPTLGIDRALAVLGAGWRYGFPVLVVDGGTALTFTGATRAADRECALVGGAILPGLRLQLQVLANATGALPAIELPADLPVRWARDTTDAIASGVLHGAVAAIADFSRAWQHDYPASALILTGGDGPLLLAGLYREYPRLGAAARLDPRVDLAGLQYVRMCQGSIWHRQNFREP